ncbi:hypothetical protein [Bacillus solitudinis]|uniref:hypothetical protein n=1 Tax=Bacillus solitudinis TaxID=2014074 RepID=UPI000C24EAE6|nr:hypothetical protein [Bacillus solitudinis]
MQIKALVRKEWKQGKVVLMLITLLFIFQYPMRAVLGLQDLRETRNENWFMPEHQVPNIFGPGVPTMLIIVFIVLLAVQFIGLERNTRRHDFSFALPFKRRTIFLVKWGLGTSLITAVMFFSFLLAYFLIITSEFAVYLEPYNFLSLILAPWLGYVAMYTFALFIGTITGEMVSQIALTFIFTVFPLGSMVLISQFIDLHFSMYPRYPEFLQQFVWPMYALSPPGGGSNLSLWIPAIAIVFFVILSQWLYEKNHNEHNGEFLIFKELQPIFRVGIIICFAMLGGMLFSSLVPYSLGNGAQILCYWIGAGIFIFLSYLLTKRLFTMNITVKGK